MDIETVKKTLKQYVSELDSIVSRFTKNRNGIHINRDDDYRMREIATELYDFINDHIPRSVRHAKRVVEYYSQGTYYSGTCSFNGVKNIQGVIKSLITRIERNADLFSEVDEVIAGDIKRKIGSIDLIVGRFHLVVRQLRERYSGRHTLEVEDEYDVQDLFRCLLSLYFDDIRNEEWVPSYAGGASRVDFLLPEIDTIIEIKKTRKSMSTKELGEQLIVDIAKYKKHPQCRQLVCFVYDPEARITNPRGLESDLNNCDKDIDVQTFIVPKHQ